MNDALENPTIGGSCLEFFGLERLPFAPLRDAEPIFRAEQYALLESHIAGMIADTDCLFVLRGAEGAGKTTVLKRCLGALSNASVALIDETCEDGTDFYCAFLRQMGFADIAGKLQELRTITREFLVHRAAAGDHVLLVIDNAPRVRPAVLEQLRWISGIRHDKRRVLNVVIAGTSELDRIMESPAMSGLRFATNVKFTIRAFTHDETAAYIRHHLDLAGCADALVFTPAACDLVHRYAGGLPQAINHIGSLLLAEAASRQLRTVDDALVRDIARVEELPISVASLANRGRRRTDAGQAARLPDASAAASSGAGIAELLKRIEALSERVCELESERADTGELRDALSQLEALRGELAAKDATIDDLRERLDALDHGRTQVLKGFAPTPNHEEPADYSADDADEEIAPIVAFQVIRNGKIERVFEAGPDGTRILIGRGEDANLRLESDYVSRHHSLLLWDAGECHVEDLGSFNGTIVNGSAVSRCRLKPGQLMVIGNFIIRPVAAAD